MADAIGAADVVGTTGVAGTDAGVDAGVTIVVCFLRLLMMYLLFVEGHGELSYNDAAERDQRLFSLVLRQPTPQLIETYGPATNWARGGITTISPDMGHLLEPILDGPETISATVAGR